MTDDAEKRYYTKNPYQTPREKRKYRIGNVVIDNVNDG